MTGLFLLMLTAPASRAQTTPPAAGSVAVSDAAYAEVSALSYAALRSVAVDLRNALNNATSQDTTVILITRETIDAQLALGSATVQLDNVNERFCTLLRAPTLVASSPAPAAASREFSLSVDPGSIASGAAAIAQLFTPHSSSASAALTPDVAALIADLIGAGRPIILPDLYLPSPSEIAPDPLAAQKPCGWTYSGAQATAPQSFSTLWLTAQVSAAQLRAVKKPIEDVKSALTAYDDLVKSYLVADPKSGSVYAQMLHAQALKHNFDPARKPVLLTLGIDAMGGTTSEAGKTSFTSHTRYSGGVVIHYIAWQLSPDGPTRPVAAGTLTRTLANQSESDLQPFLNR